LLGSSRDVRRSDRDKTGETRIRCSAVRESGSCANRPILYLAEVEEAVLRGMAEELGDPRLIVCLQ